MFLMSVEDKEIEIQRVEIQEYSDNMGEMRRNNFPDANRDQL